MSTTSSVFASAIKVNSRLSFFLFSPTRHELTALDCTQATEQLERLLRNLAEIGLEVEVRPGDAWSLLIFIRAHRKSLGRAVYQSRYETAYKNGHFTFLTR